MVCRPAVARLRIPCPHFAHNLPTICPQLPISHVIFCDLNTQVRAGLST